ncbi:fucolectin-6-like [Oncorhynchus nerka]|uniref:fucolectin-6-like n=1 Tax=Oncorhynchus nerka TaxID=8023 RepID=UPI0031B86B95
MVFMAMCSCTHTKANYNPWWRLDLLKTYKVFSIIITNTVDICAVISSIPGGFSSTFQCNGMEGRHVNVVIPGRSEHLTLCEVEVVMMIDV